MNKLPDGWEVKSLGEIVESDRKITYGIVQPGKYTEGGIPLIRGKDYSSGKVTTHNLFYVSVEIDGPYKRSKVKPYDILLSIAGYTGQVAMVPPILEGANITQTTARICPINSIASNRFLFYYLVSQLGQQEVNKYTKGSAQSGLNLQDVEKFLVTLPPLSEQKKIAEILSSVDRTIEATEKLIAKLQDLKKALMQELFTKGIGHTRFKDSPLGRIPEEWEVVRLKEFAKNEKNSFVNGPLVVIYYLQS